MKLNIATQDRDIAATGSPDSLYRCQKAHSNDSNGAFLSPKFRTSFRFKMRHLRVLRQGRYCKDDYAITNISDPYNDPAEPESSPSTSSASSSTPIKQFTETVTDTPKHYHLANIDTHNLTTRRKRNQSIPVEADARGGQSKQIQNVSPTSLKSSIDELLLSSKDLGIPKLSDSGASNTPVCYQMTTTDNPFVLAKHDDTPTNEVVTGNLDNLNCNNTMTSSMSSISSMSIGTAAQPSCHHHQQQQPLEQPHPDPTHIPMLFQSLEIRCRMNRPTTGSSTPTTTTIRTHSRKLYLV